MYKCDECDYIIKEKYRLERHLLVHSKERPYKCDKCSFSTKTKNYLKNHLQNVHEKMASFSCEKCFFKTTNMLYLRRHFKRNHMELKENNTNTDYKFKCDVCDKSFQYQSRLKEHQLSHSDVRPFKCTKCNFSAKLKFGLDIHQLVHKDDSEAQKFSCSHCDYVTKYRSAMKYHERTQHVRRHEECFRDEDGNCSNFQTSQSCELKRDSNDHIESSIDHSYGNLCTEIKVEDNLISPIKIETDAFEEYCNKNSESILSNGDQSNLLEVGDHENIFESVTNLDIKKECVDTNEEDLAAPLNTKLIEFNPYRDIDARVDAIDGNNITIKSEQPDDT